MNRVKKISAVVMALALVMCFGYFSVMSPTTAWFYQSQSVSGSNNKFVFADFDIDSNYSFENALVFDGATAYEDADEDKETFDSVVKVIDVEVKNDGGLPARVYATVKNTTDAKGLKYFYYTEDMVVNGSVKETIYSALNNNVNDKALKEYNVGEDGNSGRYIKINPGESKMVKVALWIEYDECGMETAFANSPWDSINYSINITMTATQDADGAMER